MSIGPTLTYETPNPLARLRRLRRGWIIVLVIIALLISGTIWRGTLVRQWRINRIIWLQNRAMSQQHAPDDIAYQYSANAFPVVATAGAAEEFVQAFGRAALRGYSPPIAFSHGRKSSSGHERLVLVYLSCRPGFTPNLYWTAVIPGDYSGARPQFTEAGNLPFSSGGKLNTLKCYYGQPDPSDQSHFTIRMEVNGIMRTVNGWLLDTDRVLLERVGGLWEGPHSHVPTTSYIPKKSDDRFRF